MSCSFLCTQYLVGAPFAWMTASMRRGMEVIGLWHCSGVMKHRLLWYQPSGHLIVGSGVSHLRLGSLPPWFMSGEFAGQSSTVTHGHWTSFWYRWQCGQVPSPAGKWNQHLHKACQQKEAWSALKSPGRCLRWLWTSENTEDQHQQMTWQPKPSLTVEASHWTSSNMDSVPLLSSSRLWDPDLQIKCNIYFHLKRGLWSTEQQSSSSSDDVSVSEVAW